MEIRILVDDDFINRIMLDSGIKRGNKVVSESMQMFKWLLKEARNGRIIYSSDPDGQNVKKIITPALQHAREKGQKE